VRKFEDADNKTKIFDTGASGAIIKRDTGKGFYAVRVDKENSDLIMKYIDSVSPLPEGWEHLREPSGEVYYSNLTLGKTQYERPPPTGWESLKDNNGFVYYGNPALKIVQYEFPKCVLQPGWEALKDPSGRVSYGNRTLKTVQWGRPCASAPFAPSVSANPVLVPSSAPSAPSIKYYVKVGDGDFPYKDASKPLENTINELCPNDNSTCQIELVRADQNEQAEIQNYNTQIQNQNQKNNLNGGAKNKKKHMQTKRRKLHKRKLQLHKRKSQSHSRKSHRRRMI